MKSRIIKVFSILMITIMTCTILNTKAYAWNIGDLGMEENVASVMPETGNRYVEYNYSIGLPTGSGSFFVRFQDAYCKCDSSSSLWSHADGEIWVCDDEGDGYFN